MRILVTGGLGFIGSHLVRYFLREHAEVHILDLHAGENGNVPASAVLHIQDISDPESVNLVRHIAPDYLFHLAAQSDVQKSIQNPSLDADSNIMGTIHMLEACRQSNVRKIIFASTSGVYGQLEKKLISEVDEVSPVSFYALSKRTSEQYMEMYRQLFGVSYTILRYGNVYGPGQQPKGEGGVVAVFLSRLQRSELLSIHGDGLQTRDFIYVRDIVSANAAAMQKGDGQTFNISTGESTSIRMLADLFREIVGAPIPLVYKPGNPGDVKHSCLDNRKALQLLNWRPAYNIRTGLEETIRNTWRT